MPARRAGTTPQNVAALPQDRVSGGTTATFCGVRVGRDLFRGRERRRVDAEQTSCRGDPTALVGLADRAPEQVARRQQISLHFGAAAATGQAGPAVHVERIVAADL